MPDTVSDLARQLADNAEAVCRHYLSSGRREGRYWLVGDVHNTPGRSLYVRLHGGAPGAAGRWTDAATGEHGDLLDLICAARNLDGIGRTLDEARRFLGLARPTLPGLAPSPAPAGSPESAQRLFHTARPVAGTLAAHYLRSRGIVLSPDMDALRFHPRCWYRPAPGDPDTTRNTWPALISAVTDLDGTITAVQRTWLELSGHSKARLSTPRRAMGSLIGNAVRFGESSDVLAVGEGIETVLSLRCAMPAMPLAAALSATHLAAIRLPTRLSRLYLIRDNDAAGGHAAVSLAERAQQAGIDCLTLTPTLGDFNDDLRELGADALAAALRSQLTPDDVHRFWRPPNAVEGIRG